MKLESPSLSLASLQPLLKRLSRYRALLFIVFVAGLFGYFVFQISQAASIGPAEAELTKAVPRIDPTVVQQLQSLEDNSVSVQSLFNDARSNPFE